MKVIVAGTRGLFDQGQVDEAIRLSGFQVTEVVSGAARGVDRMGEAWALWNNVPAKQFHAQWRERDGHYNPSAGHIRNGEMARYADALVAVWDGRSPGTKHMITQANFYGLLVYVYDARPGAVNKPKVYK